MRFHRAWNAHIHISSMNVSVLFCFHFFLVVIVMKAIGAALYTYMIRPRIAWINTKDKFNFRGKFTRTENGKCFIWIQVLLISFCAEIIITFSVNLDDFRKYMRNLNWLFRESDCISESIDWSEVYMRDSLHCLISPRSLGWIHTGLVNLLK